jgi:hypothetical protein
LSASDRNQKLPFRFAQNLNLCSCGSGKHAHLLAVQGQGHLRRFAQDAGLLRVLGIGDIGEEKEQGREENAKS